MTRTRRTSAAHDHKQSWPIARSWAPSAWRAPYQMISFRAKY